MAWSSSSAPRTWTWAPPCASSRCAQRNIIASKEVTAAKAVVTANLYNVTFNEALDALLKPNGFDYVEKGNFIYVYTTKELDEIRKRDRKTANHIFHLHVPDRQGCRGADQAAAVELGHRRAYARCGGRPAPRSDGAPAAWPTRPTTPWSSMTIPRTSLDVENGLKTTRRAARTGAGGSDDPGHFAERQQRAGHRPGEPVGS